MALTTAKPHHTPSRNGAHLGSRATPTAVKGSNNHPQDCSNDHQVRLTTRVRPTIPRTKLLECSSSTSDDQGPASQLGARRCADANAHRRIRLKSCKATVLNYAECEDQTAEEKHCNEPAKPMRSEATRHNKFSIVAGDGHERPMRGPAHVAGQGPFMLDFAYVIG